VYGARAGPLAGRRAPAILAIRKETTMNNDVLYGQQVLAAGIRSRLVDNHNGCTMHVLEAGYETPGRPCVVLLHGFPEIAFSWRRQLTFLADAGFHAIAPDARGYGRSGGAGVRYDDDLLPYSVLDHVADTLGLVRALGYEEVAAVVGHDYGSRIAAWCALVRPDVFRSVVLMSAPFAGAPPLPLGEADGAAQRSTLEALPAALAALPRPRKHYWWYYATREANDDMWRCPQGVHDFLRAYFHMKSADWPGNRPFPLASWAATELAQMPTYYIMDLDRDMAQTVAPEMPDARHIAQCRWLPDEELAVYAAEYGRTGFQGGLQGYRVSTEPRFAGELRAFAHRTIDVPSCFISGAQDWGNYQGPGALEAMRERVCTRMTGVHLLEGAGHWVQQEAAKRVNALLAQFLRQAADAAA
jgi:pimeloyl-ACP methyl ester carboxylesterase